MEIRILGRDLEVSEIGFGCMGMSHAYGTVSTQKEAEELIEKAIDEGCTFFDTAEIYGTTEDPHHNEKLLGKGNNTDHWNPTFKMLLFQICRRNCARDSDGRSGRSRTPV